MNKNKIKNIIFSIFLTAVFSATANVAYAVETVHAQEILTKQDKIDAQNAEKLSPSSSASKNILGQEEDITIREDKPEFAIKSLGEIIQERRVAKSEKMVEQPKKEQDLIINCSEMEYFDETGDLEARDNVEITTDSGVKVYADKAIYNRDANTLKLLNNISLLKGNATVNGDYMLIDLNEENAIMDEPTTRIGNIVINAQEGYAFTDRIENLNGNIEMNKRIEMELVSKGFSGYERSINDKRLVDFNLKKERSKPYKFKTKEIIIRAEKDHDSMIMNNVDIYYGKRKILNVPSIEIFQDKEMTYSEINFPPEIGSVRGFGTYVGMGYTFKLPKTFRFRLTPALTYADDKFGFGVIGKLDSDRVQLKTAWSTSTSNIIVDGKFKITDRLTFDIGRHVYKNEWLNGGTRAGYIGELSYNDSYVVKELGDAIFRHRISGGYVADYKRDHQEDHMKDGFRYSYQAELAKVFKRYGSQEQDMYLDIGATGQVMATVYSETGDTTGFFKVGPTISSRVKRWNSNIMYLMGGVHGKSPYVFDEYRYGRQTIVFDESIICNKYLSLGYTGAISPLKDNFEKEILTENAFYAVVGPEDFKIAFSYDTIRENLRFDFLFLLGSDNLDIKYDKLTVKDPDKVGKKQHKESDRELNKIKVPETL